MSVKMPLKNIFIIIVMTKSNLRSIIFLTIRKPCGLLASDTGNRLVDQENRPRSRINNQSRRGSKQRHKLRHGAGQHPVTSAGVRGLSDLLANRYPLSLGFGLVLGLGLVAS